VRCRRRDIEVWSSGGVLQVCGCGGVCLKSSGALEVRCRRCNIEVWRSGTQEAGSGPGDVKV